MNKLLARQIAQEMQFISLQRMQQPVAHLHPFSQAYIPVPFHEKNFISLIPAPSDKQTLFIDGGNAEILRTPECSLQFLRFAAVGFYGTKRCFTQKKEGYVLVHSLQRDGAMRLTLTGYGDFATLAPFILSHDSPLLLTGNQQTKLHVFAELFRGLYEIQFARDVLQKLVLKDTGAVVDKSTEALVDKNILLVFDRSLLPANLYEENAFHDLYSIAEQQKIDICGLNKTTALLTNTGESIVQCLSRFAKPGCWIYFPLFSSYDPHHKALLSFVKLHPLSQHIFRFEVHTAHQETLVASAAALASLSTDGAFLGYPYGLVAVDQLARVSNKEKESLQLLFLSHTKEMPFSIPSTTALDAHDILDKMS